VGGKVTWPEKVGGREMGFLNSLFDFGRQLWVQREEEFIESSRIDKNKLARLLFFSQPVDLCSLKGHIYIPSISLIHP
jgi:hypothetical protein